MFYPYSTRWPSETFSTSTCELIVGRVASCTILAWAIKAGVKDLQKRKLNQLNDSETTSLKIINFLAVPNISNIFTLKRKFSKHTSHFGPEYPAIQKHEYP